MADQLFVEYKENLLRGVAPDITTVAVVWYLIDEGTWVPDPASAGDSLLSDRTGEPILMESGELGTKTIAGALFDAADPTLFDPGGGVTGESLILCTKPKAVNAVTAVDTTNDTFTVSGDHSADFPEDSRFDKTATAAATYTVDSVTVDGTPDTIITVHEDITDATVDGNLESVDESLARLIAYIDQASELPITQDGTDDSITHNASGIFQL